MPNLSNKAIYVYAFLLMLHIFSYTATMDQKQYAIITDFVKLVLGLILIYVFGFSWFGLGAIFTISIATYLLASFGITFYLMLPDNNLVKDPQKLQYFLLVDVIFVILLLSIIIRQLILIIIFNCCHLSLTSSRLLKKKAF